MYEIEIMNINTNEINYLFGYSVKDAFKKKKLDPNEWEVMYVEYID